MLKVSFFLTFSVNTSISFFFLLWTFLDEWGKLNFFFSLSLYSFPRLVFTLTFLFFFLFSFLFSPKIKAQHKKNYFLSFVDDDKNVCDDDDVPRLRNTFKTRISSEKMSSLCFMGFFFGKFEFFYVRQKMFFFFDRLLDLKTVCVFEKRLKCFFFLLAMLNFSLNNGKNLSTVNGECRKLGKNISFDFKKPRRDCTEFSPILKFTVEYNYLILIQNVHSFRFSAQKNTRKNVSEICGKIRWRKFPKDFILLL